jgi:ATP-binding cassette subfamily F protein 2
MSKKVNEEISMSEVEDPKEKKARKKAEAAAKRAAKKAGKSGGKSEGVAVATKEGKDESIFDNVSGDAKGLTDEQIRVAVARAVTGTLSSKPVESDLKFDSFSLMVGGNQLINDCHLELSVGKRYGIIGTNGSGKSNVLSAIAQRDIPVPAHIDMYHLHEEAPANEQTGVEAVIDHVREEADRLEQMSQDIMEEGGPEDERLEAIFNRLDELDPTGSEPRARKILFGLGFADHLIPMDRKTKHMSGGWRMRVSLAKALFAAPSLLLLDEPTNHLDLEACVWLEEHLATYKKCLLVVSHSEDFLNTVCSDTIWLNNCTLKYYGGNYSTFCKVVDEELRVQTKLYDKQQADMEKLATYVRVNKANGAATSAKSKKKVLEKVNADAVERPIERGASKVWCV